MDRLKLEPVMFGHYLLRLIHQIVSLRKKDPNKKIWIRKKDLKLVYRRLHLRTKSALKSVVRVKINGKWYIIIYLRITFGGTSGLVDVCLFSGIVCDTINDLLACNTWDKKEICSDFVKNILPAEDMDDNTPYAETSEISVDIPVEETGEFNVYIDDFIGITVDIDNNKFRIGVAPCTMIYTVSNNPVNENHTPRDNMIEVDKCIEEGAIAEEMICIGCILNTRKLLVKLPEHKCKIWNADLKKLSKE